MTTGTVHDEAMADLALDDAGSSWIDTFSALDPKAFLHGFLSQQVRADGRLFRKCRETTVTPHILTRNAAGSALVRLGHTQVVATTTLLVGTPAAGHASRGDLVVNSPHKATWLQRVLMESDLVDFERLSIVQGQSAWRLQVVLVVLNDDGNLSDAMLLAAVAALRDTMLPNTMVDKEGVVHIAQGESTPLCAAVCNLPIPLTAGFVKNVNDNELLLVDPTKLEEEHAVESTLTMVVSSETKEIVNVDLAGSVAVSAQQLALVAQMALGRAQEVASLLQPTNQ